MENVKKVPKIPFQYAIEFSSKDFKDLAFNHGKFARFIVQVRPECYEHADCPSYDICDQGNCVDACRVTTCGSNARCENRIHAASCICLPNYVGNPRVACNPRKLRK